MKFKVLNKNEYFKNEYKLVPIRMKDRFLIMKWRNEQIFHLRQKKLLTEDAQDYYFNSVVAKLFEVDKPSQILFSYLKNKECIGYGGLVHINWEDRNSELSFLINTEIQGEEFELHWNNYLSMIEEVAFHDIKLHKLFTFAFDVRPRLYQIFENNGFKREAILEDHCLIDGEFKKVIIHGKTNRSIV